MLALWVWLSFLTSCGDHERTSLLYSISLNITMTNRNKAMGTTIRRMKIEEIYGTMHKSLSTLATIYSPISATICRRKQRLSQKSATVTEFGDCRRWLAVFCDIRRFRRQSHFAYISIHRKRYSKSKKMKKYTKQTIYNISFQHHTQWSLLIYLSFRCTSCSLGNLKLNISWH